MTVSSETVSKLFRPAKVGDIDLLHRVVLAPLTRRRATSAHVHTDIAVKYYEQRASVPGTLLISEAVFVAPFAKGMCAHIPGIGTEEQIAAWKRVVDAVHAKGSYIFLQMWAGGRAGELDELKAEGLPYVGASDVPLKGREDEIPRPHESCYAEIKEYTDAYAQTARNAVNGAGFDGVEVHGAHGYLIDQFIQDVSNRTDEYGGSIENRARFALEVLDAVTEAVGESKTGIRFSPWNTYLDMKMDDPVPTFTYLVSRIVQDHPGLAYLHIVEPGLAAVENVDISEGESNDFIRKLWLPRPLISAGRYTRDTAIAQADKTGELIAFGRRFISNPDLPLRLRKNLPLNGWDRKHYYTFEDPHGYIDYPFVEDEE